MKLPATTSARYGMMYIDFSGNNITVSALGMNISGTYKIKGNQILVKTNVLGYEAEVPYSFSQKGDTIIFEGETYIKSGSAGRESNGGTIILVSVLLLLVAGVVIILYKKKSAGTDVQQNLSDLGSKVSKTSKDLYASASVVGTKVAKGVSASVKAGVAATKAAAQEYQANQQMRQTPTSKVADSDDDWEEVPSDDGFDDAGAWELVGSEDDSDEWEAVSGPAVRNQVGRHSAPAQPKIVPISKDCCCICGKKLGEGSTKLAGLPSGAEAYIDRDCLKVLSTIANTKDYNDFENASRYLKARFNYIDPELKTALTGFLRKGEERINSELFKS